MTLRGDERVRAATLAVVLRQDRRGVTYLLGRHCALPGCELWVDSTRLAEESALLADHVRCSGWVTDAHLALVAGAHGGSSVIFDSRAAVLAQDLGAQAVLLEA